MLMNTSSTFTLHVLLNLSSNNSSQHLLPSTKLTPSMNVSHLDNFNSIWLGLPAVTERALYSNLHKEGRMVFSKQIIPPHPLSTLLNKLKWLLVDLRINSTMHKMLGNIYVHHCFSRLFIPFPTPATVTLHYPFSFLNTRPTCKSFPSLEMPLLLPFIKIRMVIH